MARIQFVVATSVVLIVTLIGSPGPAAAGQAPAGAQWISAWATSPQSLGDAVISNATVRMIARVTIAGESVRVRLDNSYGTSPLVVEAAYVGARMRGASLVPGSNRQVLFNGSPKVTIPPGEGAQSDPVQMTVIPREDLAVSLYVPGADVRPSQHGQANVTSYLTANGSGNMVDSDAATPFTGTTTSTYWLKAIDVLSSSSPGAIVAFGDSITDGTCSTTDAHDRWEDWLAARFQVEEGGGYPAILNEGIGGNTVTREHLMPAPSSTPGIERLDRDVLSHQGVTHVVVFMGTNDIRRGASAAQVIGGMEGIIERVKGRGHKIIGVTIIPRHNRAATEGNSGWDETKTDTRNEVNEWIRTGAKFDGVIDFDQVVRDPSNPNQIAPLLNCDGIHPTPRGYFEMGRSVPLELFAK